MDQPPRVNANCPKLQSFGNLRMFREVDLNKFENHLIKQGFKDNKNQTNHKTFVSPDDVNGPPIAIYPRGQKESKAKSVRLYLFYYKFDQHEFLMECCPTYKKSEGKRIKRERKEAEEARIKKKRDKEWRENEDKRKEQWDLDLQRTKEINRLEAEERNRQKEEENNNFVLNVPEEPPVNQNNHFTSKEDKMSNQNRKENNTQSTIENEGYYVELNVSGRVRVLVNSDDVLAAIERAKLEISNGGGSVELLDSNQITSIHSVIPVSEVA